MSIVILGLAGHAAASSDCPGTERVASADSDCPPIGVAGSGCWETPPRPHAGGYVGRRKVWVVEANGSVVARRFQTFSPSLAVGPVPLVIAFHPYGYTGETFASFAGLDAKAIAGRFVVAYPDGCSGAWNTADCCGPRLRDDVAFADAIIVDVERALRGVAAGYSVDRSRVFAAGYSNGGFLAYKLACDRPGTYAALATVASVPPRGCVARVPVLHFHGTNDPLIPLLPDSPRTIAYPDGANPSLPLQDAATALSQWAAGMEGGPSCPGFHPWTVPGINASIYTMGPSAANAACRLRGDTDVTRVSVVVVPGGDHSWLGSTAGVFADWAWNFFTLVRP